MYHIRATCQQKKQNQHKAGLVRCFSTMHSRTGKVETAHVGGKNLSATISNGKSMQSEEALVICNPLSRH